MPVSTTPVRTRTPMILATVLATAAALAWAGPAAAQAAPRPAAA